MSGLFDGELFDHRVFDTYDLTDIRNRRRRRCSPIRDYGFIPTNRDCGSADKSGGC